MTYLKRSKRPRQGSKALAAIALLLAIVFGVSYFFPTALPTVFYPITSIFWKSESSSVGFFATMGRIVGSKYSLIKENESLKVEIASRDRSALLMDSLMAENESLKATLGRTGKGSFVLGIVLSRPPVSPYDTLVLDVGSSDGVKAGSKVYAEGNVLMGDVTDALSGESKASLYSTPGRTTQVLIGTSTIAAEATGEGGGNFSVKLPAKTPVSVGDSVTVSQIHPHILGVVAGVELDSSGSFQTVVFKSPVNIHELPFVEVEVTKEATK